MARSIGRMCVFPSNERGFQAGVLAFWSLPPLLCVIFSLMGGEATRITPSPRDSVVRRCFGLAVTVLSEDETTTTSSDRSSKQHGHTSFLVFDRVA
jgi:hypothetical protein